MKKVLFLFLFVSGTSLGCLGCTPPDTASPQQIAKLRTELDSLKKINNELNQRLIRLEEWIYRNPETEPLVKRTRRIKRPVDRIADRTIYTGPRGGRYYINEKGKKVYIKK